MGELLLYASVLLAVVVAVAVEAMQVLRATPEMRVIPLPLPLTIANPLWVARLTPLPSVRPEDQLRFLGIRNDSQEKTTGHST